MVNYLIYKSKIGNGVGRPGIPSVIKKVLDAAEKDSETPIPEDQRVFKNNLPPKSWVYRFVERHPRLSSRIPEHLGHMRKQVTKHGIKAWFLGLEAYLAEEHNLDCKTFFVPENSHRVFNLDETGFPLCGSNKLKIVTEKGSKNVYNVATESKEQITVLGCASGDGELQKPFVIFPGVRPVFNFQQVDPAKYNVGSTPNGWISSDSFFTWFTSLFFSEIKDKVQFPIVVFMDGHVSHINLAISEFCQANNIILYCFLPHASHIVQPLDISVYGPLKKNWNQALTNFKERYQQPMSKNNFFTVFDEAWELAKQVPQNVTSGFRKAGLIPFNPDAVDYSRIINEGDAAKKFRESTASKRSADQRLGLMMSLECFEKSVSKENKAMIKRMYDEGDDVDDASDFGQLFKMFKSVKDLLKANLLLEDEDVTVPVSANEPEPAVTHHHHATPTLQEISTVVAVSNVERHSPEELSAPGITNSECSMLPEPIASTSFNAVETTESDPMPSVSVVPSTSGSNRQIEMNSLPQSQSTPNKTRPANENPKHSLNEQPDQSLLSNASFYGNFDISPFKAYLRIDEKVAIKRKETKSKLTRPPAVSGKLYYDMMLKKQEAKVQEEENKKKRKEERERKKQEKEAKKSCSGRKKSGEDESEDENEIVLNDDSDDDVVLEETNECKACGGEEDADDQSAWIGCQKCSNWYHKLCLNPSYSTLSVEEIQNLDFTCRVCQTRKKKTVRKLNL